MLTRLTRTAPWMLAIGAMAWLLGITAAQVHVFRVMHVVCDAHGAVIELDAHGAGDPRQPLRDEARPAAPDAQHDHGCALAHAGFQEGLLGHDTVESGLPELVLAVSSLAGESPATPPLRYAPKTSPPTHRA